MIQEGGIRALSTVARREEGIVLHVISRGLAAILHKVSNESFPAFNRELLFERDLHEVLEHAGETNDAGEAFGGDLLAIRAFLETRSAVVAPAQAS